MPSRFQIVSLDQGWPEVALRANRGSRRFFGGSKYRAKQSASLKESHRLLQLNVFSVALGPHRLKKVAALATLDLAIPALDQDGRVYQKGFLYIYRMSNQRLTYYSAKG